MCKIRGQRCGRSIMNDGESGKSGSKISERGEKWRDVFAKAEKNGEKEKEERKKTP